MKHIGTTTDNEVILTLTVTEIRDILLYLNSAELRYAENGFKIALEDCDKLDQELYNIWEKVK